VASKPQDRTLAAWRSLLEAHAVLLDRLSRELEAETGLPVGFYDVLLHLNEAPQRRLPMHELAHRVLISKSGLTRLVDRMVAEGYLEREPAEDDRRVVYACLTASGRDRLVGAAPVHLRGIAEHFGRHLSDAEADTLRELLGRVIVAGTRDPGPDPRLAPADPS